MSKGPRPHRGHRKHRRRWTGAERKPRERVTITTRAECICGQVWTATFESGAPIPRSPCHPEVFLSPLDGPALVEVDTT